MSLQDTVFGMLNIAGGFVLGTLLTWLISYYAGKRILPRLLKSLSNNPEVINAIQALMEKVNSKKDS